MVLLFFFQIKMQRFIFCCGASCPLVFQLHHTSVSSLHHAYCAVLSSFTMGTISVLSSSPWIDVLLWTWSFWYDFDLSSVDSSEVGGILALCHFCLLSFQVGVWWYTFNPDIVEMGLYQSCVFSFCYFSTYIYITSMLFSMTCLLHQKK